MHLIFANFHFDEEGATTLAKTLIKHKINVNLVDQLGFSPIHVALKKNEASAVQFAVRMNPRMPPH